MEMRFDPVRTSRHIANSYSDYLLSTTRFSDKRLQDQYEAILSRPGFLFKGPFLEATPPYTKGLSVRQLVERGMLCDDMLHLGGGDSENFDPDLVLYEHQVRAIELARAGKNFIVTTGTGSGKTECFLFPMIDDILREQEERGARPGVRALILYPMNALANDQLKRLRRLLAGTSITFGRYVGDTSERSVDAINGWRKDHPGEALQENELISRQQMRATPPNILLTNYSMLEYLLLRPKDDPFFNGVFGSSWRHIAIDEAHVYSGTLGTEIAYLLRRLKARVFGTSKRRTQLHCYATSATMGTEDDRPQVAKFAEDLFGEPFDQDPIPAVVASHRDNPMDYFRDRCWGALPTRCWEALRDAIEDRDPNADQLRSILRGAVPDSELSTLEYSNVRAWLSELLLGDENSRKIVERVGSSSEDPLDLTDLSRLSELSIDDLPCDANGARMLSAMVEVLSYAEFSEGVPILASRYHTFFRAPEGLFLTLDDMHLSRERSAEQTRANGDKVPVYEVSVCRHCGEAYVLGTITPSSKLAWLDPKRVDLDSDEGSARTYFRILSSEEDVDAIESLMWLCPKCGSLHDSSEGGEHRYAHEGCQRVPFAEGKANEEVARCGHCGYQHRNAIQALRVSPEAAGSVVCYDLVRDIPPFTSGDAEEDFDDLFGVGSEDGPVQGGSVVCFSDRRQDAAYFAPAMMRTYGNITKRQLIRKSVDELCGRRSECKPSDVAAWIAQKMKRDYKLEDVPQTDIGRMNAANAMVLDELMAEDSRNSLEGLGVVDVYPSAFDALVSANQKAFATLANRIRSSSNDLSWLTVDDYIKILRVCLESLRSNGALALPDGAKQFMQVHVGQIPVVVGGGDDVASRIIRFVPASPSGNNRTRYVMTLAQKNHGIAVTLDEAKTLLRVLYEDLRKILRTLSKREGADLLVEDSDTGGFLISPDLWSLRPHSEDGNLYLCDTCGCMIQYDTAGICVTRGCLGEPHRVKSEEVFGKDRYYKLTYREEPLPIRIEEHTAQLSTKRAAAVQQDFIEGKVNVLSCTTTFELGVDVGDLRATFLRNVPPSPANYAQRAGRVGRRAGKPGFAVTFARLRPHDIEYFRNPQKIIAGVTHAPYCYLSNSSIAIRHLFAVVLSEFFRSKPEREVYADEYNDFMLIAEKQPKRFKELVDFIDTNKAKLEAQLMLILPASVQEELGVGKAGSSWVDALAGQDGRLMAAHDLLHDDWSRLEHAVETAKAENKYNRAASNLRLQQMLLHKKTIQVLASSGVLPKYGFPTDLVELSLLEQENSLPETRLDLSRGLRLAIREYAPGSKVVAGKRVWESVGITRPRNRSFEIRRYGICSNKDCQSFVVPIDTGESSIRCPLCSEQVYLSNRILIPANGFRGREVSKREMTRPRNGGYVDIKFAQTWSSGNQIEWYEMRGGRLGVRTTESGRLYAINRGPGGLGFSVCGYCGAAAPHEGRLTHENWCLSKESQRYSGLGTDFTTDVLELTFAMKSVVQKERLPWRSVMWALVQAAISVMNVPEGEIGATTYRNFDTHDESILIYDNVPGGAGRASQLSENVELLLNRAFEIVNTCDCGEDSCCYGCLCNYTNQYEQDRLSRGAARDILGSLLFGD